MPVIHKVNQWNTPQCGAGYKGKESPENYTQDPEKVTCKSCLKWMQYYKNKAAAKNGRA